MAAEIFLRLTPYFQNFKYLLFSILWKALNNRKFKIRAQIDSMVRIEASKCVLLFQWIESELSASQRYNYILMLRLRTNISIIVFLSSGVEKKSEMIEWEWR